MIDNSKFQILFPTKKKKEKIDIQIKLEMKMRVNFITEQYLTKITGSIYWTMTLRANLLAQHRSLLRGSNCTEKVLIYSPNYTPFFSKLKSQARLPSIYQLHSANPHSSSEPVLKNRSFIEISLLFAFSLILLCLRLCCNVILPDFPHRWRALIAFSAEAEAKIRDYPSHLWQSITAYEDRRFFSHFGVDPVGIARAVLSLSSRGGGSTITQQVVLISCLFNVYAHQLFGMFADSTHHPVLFIS